MKRPEYKSRSGKPVQVCISVMDWEKALMKKLAKKEHGGNVSFYLRSLVINDN